MHNKISLKQKSPLFILSWRASYASLSFWKFKCCIREKKNQPNHRKQSLNKNILFCFLRTHWGGSSESLTTSNSKKKTSRLLADAGFHRQHLLRGAVGPDLYADNLPTVYFAVRKATLLFFAVHGLHNPNSHVHSAVSPNTCFPEESQIQETD